MKIAFALFRYFPFGGLQRDMFAIASELARRGHQTDLYCYDWQGAELPPWLTVHLLPVRGISNHGRAASFISALGKQWEKDQPECRFAFNRIPGADLYFAADNCFAAAAIRKWGGWRKFIPRCRVFEEQERAIFSPQSKTQILYLTPCQLPDFERIYHTPPERFHLLPPGIAADRRPPADLRTVRRKIREELSAGEGDILLLQVAAAFHTKGVDRSIAALASLPGSLRSRTILAVAGAGDDGCRKLAGSYGVAGQCRFLGSRSDIPSLAAAADLMIHPARNEATGTVLIESLAAGTPAISSACCGFSCYVAESGGRVLPEPFVQEDLNSVLEEILSHPETLAGYRKAAENYGKNHDFFHRAECAADLVEKVMREKSGF